MDVPAAAFAVPHDAPTPHTDRLPFYQIYELIENVGRHLGLGRPRQAVLLYLMRQTAPRDWTDPQGVPTCFRQQQDLADQLGMTSRQLRAHEAALAQRGLIEISTGANGRRSGTMLRNGRRLGLSFKPMLSRIGQLLNLFQAFQQRQLEIKQLRLECSAARRTVRCLLTRNDLDLTDENRDALLERCSTWPVRYASLKTRTALRSLLIDIEAVENTLVSALPKPKPSAAEAKILPPVQNTDLKEKGTCTRRAAMKKAPADRPARRAGVGKCCADSERNEEVCSTSVKDGRGRPAEPVGLSPALPAIDLAFLHQVATDDLKLIMNYRGSGDMPAQRFMRSIGIELALHLGIAPSVYDEVAEAAGDLGALLGTMYIDRRRHQVNPVRRPSAALRSFGQLHSAGRMNWTGLVMALSAAARVSNQHHRGLG